MSQDLDKMADVAAEVTEYFFLRSAKFLEAETKYSGSAYLEAVLGLTHSMTVAFSGMVEDVPNEGLATNLDAAMQNLKSKKLK